MIFDAHVHLCPDGCLDGIIGTRSNPSYQMAHNNPWEKHMKEAKKRGIVGSIIFPLPFSELTDKEKNDYILDVSRQHPEYYVPFLLISNKVEDIEPHLSEVQGIKEHFLLTKTHDIKDFAPIYDLMQQKGLILTSHPKDHHKVERISQIAENFPNLQIILAHAGRGAILTATGICEEIAPGLKKYPNVSFDTSTVRDHEGLKKFVNMVGADRVLFGSDSPFHIAGDDFYSKELLTVLKMRLSSKEQEKILYSNAERLVINPWKEKICEAEKKKQNNVLSPMQIYQYKNNPRRKE